MIKTALLAAHERLLERLPVRTCRGVYKPPPPAPAPPRADAEELERRRQVTLEMRLRAIPARPSEIAKFLGVGKPAVESYIKKLRAEKKLPPPTGKGGRRKGGR